MNKCAKAILPILLSLVLLVTGCSARSVSTGAQVGEQAPGFELQSLDGQTVSLSDLRGKAVVLNFWATWCSPCRYEMPFLQEIYEEWTGKPPSVVVLTINMGERHSTVESFMQYFNLSLPVLLDIRQDVAQKYAIIGIPTTFFIDKNGIIQGKKVGAFLSKEEIEGYLGKIIP